MHIIKMRYSINIIIMYMTCLIRNSRDSALVHEEQVHPLYILSSTPPLLYHWLTVQCSIQPHLTS